LESKPERALVIGGSVAGLMAGCLLHKAGWEVAVYERALGDLTGRGAGLGVSEELLAAMARAGARFEPAAGVMQRSMAWMERDGRIAFEHRRFMAASAWARVYQPLRDALPRERYQQGKTLLRVEQTASGVTAVFADGSIETAALLVAADGALSTVRRQYLPGVNPQFANYVAWRGLVAEQDVPRSTVEAVAGHIVFCFPPGEMLLCMRVPGPSLYFIWYRTVAAGALAGYFTDATGRDHGVSIPPPLIRPELVAEMKAHALDVLPAAISAAIQRTAQPLLQAISDMESPRMVFGRVALCGDAAFVVRPHVAGGAGKAAVDAACLVDCIHRNGIETGLADYELRQRDFGGRIVRHSRYLGADLEGRPTERDPRRIIRDYGAPNLLHEADPARFAAAQ
jgi:2-polyprenyl-6-methoxyphenol hydroxylase-like FAD-dependent oxidoreductase